MLESPQGLTCNTIKLQDMIVPMYKSSGKRVVAILTPSQKALLFQYLNADYQIRFEFLYRTAMRLREAMYFAEHPEIYIKDNGIIALPKVEGMGKVACTIMSRNILLNPAGIKAVEEFISHRMRFPRYQSMDEALKLAAKEADFETKGMVPKMFRKMWISHQMSSYQEQQMKIAMSAGHDYATMQGNYLMFGWRREDVAHMRIETANWGEAL